MLIRNSRLEVEVLPEVGGKIAQIRDLQTGDSVLVPPQRPYQTIPSGDRWVRYDTSGMDDCFPCVDECAYPVDPWKGTLLPQLGEWVYGTWHVAACGPASVVLERRGTKLPYLARKAVTLPSEDTVRVDYTVENASPQPFRYLWSAHPLIAAGQTYEVVLPPGRITYTTFPHDGIIREWPGYGSVDLAREWVPEGKTLKTFLSGFEAGWCELRCSTFNLRFDFDLAQTPVLGVWFNNYGFSGEGAGPFRCLAIEPCTSASDVLDALRPSSYPVIAGRSRVDWWLQVRVN